MAGKIKVPSELVPSQSNKVMLRSKYIYDDVKGHTQEEVNAALEEQIESKVIEAGGVNWDTVPTAGSNNAVKSKDIKAALEKTTGYFVLDSNVTESTVAKTVTVADFLALAIGGSIKIKMLTKNTAANPTLRIGPANATAYPLYYNNEIASASNTWEEGEVISVYFDGTTYQASNTQGGSNRKINDYLYGDVKALAVGTTYENDEAVKTTDKQFRRMTKEVGTMNLTDVVAIGDLKKNGAYTQRAKKNVGVFKLNPSTPYSSGDYAIGSFTEYTLTVTAGNAAGNITINETTITITEGESAVDIAAAIANGITIDGWTLTANGDGTIIVRCNTIGANTTTISFTDTDTTGVTISGNSVPSATGTNTIRKYDGSSWNSVDLTAYAADTDMWTSTNDSDAIDEAWLIANVTEQNSVTLDIAQKYKQTAKIEKLLESAFNIEVVDVESYTLNTASKGSDTRSVYGNVLTNDYAFDLKTIKLYCRTATSSFVIAIGEVDTEQSKYVINKSYRINKALTVGENVIDVSEYDIVIPPYALVACTGVTSYTGKTGNKMIGVISTNEGASGTYTSTFNNYYLQFVLLGTITKYHSKDGIFDTGELVSEVKIKNDFSGGKSDVLSAEQGKKLNTQFTDLVSYSFNAETIDVETPQISTETAGSGLSKGYWGTVLTNDTTIVLQSVKLYSDRALSSFKIAIGSANIEENTYHIDDCYTIQASVSVGENTIDVSEYSITIPPKALAVCTAVFHYKSTSQGCYLIGHLSSIEAGTDSSYTAEYAASSTCVYIGTAKHYDIVIPESVLEVIGRSNILFGKKYTAIGDSFTFKGTAYPHIIGNRNNMSVLNQGVSGSTLNGYITQGRYNQIPQDVDYITIWYGINDSGHHIDVGTVNDQPETITSETGTTTCGGYNWIFKWLLTNRPFAHIGVIITDYCSQTRREAIMACCQKWGIAYLDLYNPTIPMIRTRGTTQYTHDVSIAPLGYVEVCAEAKALRNTVFSTDPATTNMHPNDACHLWQSNLIENFLRSL